MFSCRGFRALIGMMLTICMLLGVCALAEYRMPVGDHELDAAEGLDERIVNILLIGTDALEDNMETGRADVLMICSISKESGEVKVTSIQRDTWVTMGDNGHQNKINAAHTFGGPNLVMQTVNREFAMNIEKYVKVNFYAVCDIVDALGGITVKLEEHEATTINQLTYEEYGDVKPVPIPAGATEATLSGTQALAYARIRHLDNDFGRTARQRKVIYAMAQKLMECSIPEMIKVATNCFEYVSTNLSLLDMIQLASLVLQKGIRDIDMMAVPGEGDYEYGKGGGPSRLMIDRESVTRKLHEFIYQ